MRLMFKRIAAWLTLLIFPPKCRFCGERQSIFQPMLPQILCPACLERWSGESNARCRGCGLAMSQCRCLPPLLTESGARALVKRTLYRKGKATVASMLVLRAKDVNDRALFDFFAAELTMSAFRALQEYAQGTDVGEVVVTYAPRSRRAALAVGHDQGQQLARALARQLGARYERVLKRTRDAGQQKRLTADERAANTRESFAVVARRSGRVAGRTVVLVDDVCTTGATLGACCQQLYAAGARDVIAVCIAQTE